MYKNIVFDIGNVLLKFNPLEYLLGRFKSQVHVEELYGEIFESREWILLDEGSITSEEATEVFCSRNPENETLIRQVMDDWYSMLTPIESSVNTLKKLKKKGYKTFALSNYHLKAFDKAINDYDFFKLFDGLVISSKINLLKPDRKIYEYLINQYSIKPEETVFIDDTKQNVDAAQNMGFATIHLACPLELDDKLKLLGIL